MKSYTLLLLSVLCFVSCGKWVTKGVSTYKTSPNEPLPQPIENKCETIKGAKFYLYHKNIELPYVARVVMESHYVTPEDDIVGYPKSKSQGMVKHMDLSCKMLLDLGFLNSSQLCKDIYSSAYSREWTPPESSKYGQNASGIKAPLVDELFQATMYFKKRPKPGTKVLLENEGNFVVAQVGYEIGPHPKMGVELGVSPEIMYFLKAKHKHKVRISLLKNKTPLGPLVCDK